MLRYLSKRIDQLRWQRLQPFQKLAEMSGSPEWNPELLW